VSQASEVARWRELRAAGHDGRRVLLVASFTANPIEPALGVALAEADGRAPRVVHANYNQLFQVCLDPAAHGATDTDEIVFLWRIEDVFERDFHAWGNDPTGADGAAEARLVADARALAAAIAELAGAVTATVTVSDAPVPCGFGHDHRDAAELARLATLQHTVNAAFDAALGAARVERLALSALQLAHGTLATFDRRNWLMYRQPFTAAFAATLGRAVAEAIAGRTRVAPKVLALDADGTLWSGIVADDGVSGLQCSDAFPGSAHREFQLAVQRLRHRGVLLTVVSKNDRANVDAVFAELDGMVLTPSDIAAWRVSWDPKPTGVADLAGELNLGLDAFVFIDDSDYEIGAMRTQLPQIITLRVPDDIEELPDLLAESGLFRGLRVTSDDRERTARIQAEAGRAAVSTTMSHAEFLAELGLRVRLTEITSSAAPELGRVAQLVNKTNQFNLTTIRRDQGEVAALAERADAAVFAAEVDDRFGEYGLVGVVIAVACGDGSGWELDTVLMSCRVLGRGVETAMLAGVVEALRARRPGRVSGSFRPTDRNAIVADLLPRHGFDTVEAGRFELPAERSIAVPDHITLVTA
jgi:FkbH-like protein